MSKGMINGALSIFLHHSNKYCKVCADENKKATTAYFGAYSIITAIVCGALFTLGLWGLFSLIGTLDGGDLSALVIVPLAVIVGVLEIAVFIEFIFGGLLGVVYQLKCNRRPIGWIALAVFIATTIGMTVGIAFILSSVL